MSLTCPNNPLPPLLLTMQKPTCIRMRVRNVHDAQVILHAVSEGILPMVRRRLDDDERQALSPGDIYVWEERGNNPMEAPSLESIQRFTDGRSWGPSKAREYVTHLPILIKRTHIISLTASS